MADTKGRISVKLVDPTTGANEAAVDATGRVSIALGSTASGALADAASAAPNTANIGAIPLLMNASTVDRQRAVIGGLDSAGTGIAAAGLVAQLDDTATTAVTENQFAPVRLSTRRALLVEGVASGTNLNVALAASSATVTVDSELPTAAALGDALSATTSTTTIAAVTMLNNAGTLQRAVTVVAAQDTTGVGVQAVGMLAQFDDTATAAVTENQYAAPRISTRRALLVEGVASGTNLNVALAASSATVTVDSELPTAAALGDAESNASTMPEVGARALVFNGTTWDRRRGAATLADALANPGIGLAQSQGFLMGYNGATWDRVRTANTGRLQVDVITGGGADTPTNPVLSYQTSAALAAGASAALETAEAASKKLRKVVVWASVPFKAVLITVDNGVASTTNKVTGGGMAAQTWEFSTPHRNYFATGTTAGVDAFRVTVTNLDQSSPADVYCTFFYED